MRRDLMVPLENYSWLLYGSVHDGSARRSNVRKGPAIRHVECSDPPNRGKQAAWPAAAAGGAGRCWPRTRTRSWLLCLHKAAKPCRSAKKTAISAPRNHLLAASVFTRRSDPATAAAMRATLAFLLCAVLGAAAARTLHSMPGSDCMSLPPEHQAKCCADKLNAGIDDQSCLSLPGFGCASLGPNKAACCANKAAKHVRDPACPPLAPCANDFFALPQ